MMDHDEEIVFAEEFAILRRDLAKRPTVPPSLFQAALDAVSIRSVRREALAEAMAGRRSRSFMLATFADVLERTRNR